MRSTQRASPDTSRVRPGYQRRRWTQASSRVIELRYGLIIARNEWRQDFEATPGYVSKGIRLVVRADARSTRDPRSEVFGPSTWTSPTSLRRTTHGSRDYLVTMNALDVYDFDDQVTPAQPASEAAPSTATGTPPTSASPTSSPTLNEEVQQVMGTLGGFWGSIRKQVLHIDPVRSETH